MTHMETKNNGTNSFYDVTKICDKIKNAYTSLPWQLGLSVVISISILVFNRAYVAHLQKSTVALFTSTYLWKMKNGFFLGIMISAVWC